MPVATTTNAGVCTQLTQAGGSTLAGDGPPVLPVTDAAAGRLEQPGHGHEAVLFDHGERSRCPGDRDRLATAVRYRGAATYEGLPMGGALQITTPLTGVNQESVISPMRCG